MREGRLATECTRLNFSQMLGQGTALCTMLDPSQCFCNCMYRSMQSIQTRAIAAHAEFIAFSRRGRTLASKVCTLPSSLMRCASACLRTAQREVDGEIPTTVHPWGVMEHALHRRTTNSNWAAEICLSRRSPHVAPPNGLHALTTSCSLSLPMSFRGQAAHPPVMAARSSGGSHC